MQILRFDRLHLANSDDLYGHFKGSPREIHNTTLYVQIFAHSMEMRLTEYRFSDTIIDRTNVLFHKKTENEP